MVNIAKELEEKIYNGQAINFEEAVKLSNSDNLEEICSAANRIRKRYCGDKVDLCSIMNARAGKCSEDCKYCAQSCYYKTNIKSYPLVKVEEALKMAEENEKMGVNRFSLVTSGRGLSGKEFDDILNIFSKLNENKKLKLCCSLGIISYEKLLKLKEVGIVKFHHNLETSREYFPKICSTHTYEDRINTIKNAKKAGLDVCSGGIIGMGETMIDRINMALELQHLNIKSIPVNILTPLKGTPMEDMKKLEDDEVIKTIAIFRFLNPKAYIRFAGGRQRLKDYGEKGLKSGANAILTGNYLTTVGNKIVDDIKMIKNLGMEVY